MSERMIAAVESLDAVAVAAAPKARPAEKVFCVELQGRWVPVRVPVDFCVQDLLEATGARSVSEMQYDTVIDRYVHLKEGHIKDTHVYAPFASDEKKLALFLAECGVHK